MTTDARSTRREPRQALRPGTSWVEYAHPAAVRSHRRATLTSMSVSGLAFVAEKTDPELPSGSILENVTLRVGDCVVKGDLVVRSTYRIEDQRLEVGSLFYPAPEYEDRWMVLNAGIEAAQPVPG